MTRTGVLTYKRADGTVVRELRHPDHVFHADSLASLHDASVTIGHPGNGQTWVSPTNARDLEVGHARDPKPEAGKYVGARLNIRRDDAIKRIDSKELVEVSAAYDCDIDPTPGVYEGQQYDQVQVGIRYNHIALLAVGKGRCGSDVRLRADSEDAVIVDPDDPDSAAPNPTTGETMSTRMVRVDGRDHELPIAAADVLTRVVQERDDAKKRADSAEALRDQMKSDLDAARDPKTVAGYVSARVALEREATKVLGAEKRFDGLTDREVREEVLKVASPNFKREGRSDDAITAAFEYAIESPARPNHGLRLVSDGLKNGEQKRADGSAAPATTTTTTDEDPDAALRAQLDEIEKERAGMWKGKGA